VKKKWAPPLLLIHWIDATGSSAWTSVEECDLELDHCVTVGWLIDENKTRIRLCDSRSFDPKDTTIGGISVIPTGWVVKRKTLRKKGEGPM
jgi:hypothetical protein